MTATEWVEYNWHHTQAFDSAISLLWSLTLVPVLLQWVAVIIMTVETVYVQSCLAHSEWSINGDNE